MVLDQKFPLPFKSVWGLVPFLAGLSIKSVLRGFQTIKNRFQVRDFDLEIHPAAERGGKLAGDPSGIVIFLEHELNRLQVETNKLRGRSAIHDAKSEDFDVEPERSLKIKNRQFWNKLV